MPSTLDFAKAYFGAKKINEIKRNYGFFEF
jgi:hypothetical protein